MKNKKSKIIVPALGLILLSTAASISGSVAWFTASRSTTVTTGSFAVVKTDGALAQTVEYGVGTAVTGSGNSSVVNPVTNAKIADVSFNPETKVLYTDNGDGDSSGYRSLGNTYNTQPTTNGSGAHAWKINDTTYYAFTWKVTLSYTWGADLTNLNVFFDYTGSSIQSHSKQDGETSTANKTETGFRLAMVGPSHTAVWAGLQNAASLAGIYGTATGNYASYGTTNLTSATFGYFASDYFASGNVAAASATAKASYAKAIDKENNQTSRADYLGTISHSDETDSITVWCVAWFEGTDPNVVNENELDQVTSQIKFYAVTAGN